MYVLVLLDYPALKGEARWSWI